MDKINSALAAIGRIAVRLWASRTATLGYIMVTLGVLASADGIFSMRTIKMILLANGLATALLGHYNSMRKRQADRAAAEPQP